jgi:hypothetical protein
MDTTIGDAARDAETQIRFRGIEILTSAEREPHETAACLSASLRVVGDMPRSLTECVEALDYGGFYKSFLVRLKPGLETSKVVAVRDFFRDSPARHPSASVEFWDAENCDPDELACFGISAPDDPEMI